MKLENIFFILFLFALPFFTRYILKPGFLDHGYFEYGTISLFPSELLLILILFFFYTRLLKNRELQKEFKIYFQRNFWIFVGILGLFLTVCLSSFFAFSKVLTWHFLFVLFLGLNLFLFISFTKIEWAYIFWPLFLSSLIQIILVFHQFLTQKVFASKWLGLAYKNSSQLGVAVVEGGGMRILRAYGSFPHPNFLGFFLSFLLILTIFYFLNKKFSITKMFYLLLLVTSIFLTFSRAAWLTLFFVFILGLLNFKSTQSSLKNIFLFCLIYFLILFFIFSPFVWARILNQNRIEARSIIERKEQVKEAFQLPSNFLFGLGAANYSLALSKTFPSRPSFSYQPIHNVFFLIFKELGLFGLIFFILFWVALFLKIKKNWEKKTLKEHFFIFAILGLLIIFLISDHFLWSLPSGILFFWLMSGLLLKANQADDKIG